MSHIQIEQAHNMSLDAAKEALTEAFAEDLEDFDIEARWEGYVAVLEGKGANGSFTIEDDKVVFDFKMSILARTGGIDPELLEEEVRKRMVAALS